MSTTTAARLLEAASQIAGSDQALARYLGVDEFLLSSYRAGLRPLPDLLMLRAVDLLLEARERPPSVKRGFHGETKPYPASP
jgi:hypothetical protein